MRTPFLLLLLLAFAGNGFAQPAPGEIGIYGDAAGTRSDSDVALFVPFDVFIVGTPDELGLKAWEARVDIPDDVFLIDAVVEGPSPIDIGPSVSPTTTQHRNFLVGIGECLFAPQPTVLARLRCLVVQSTAPWGPICLAAAIGGSSPTDAPAYVNCVNDIVPWVLGGGGYQAPTGCVQVGTGLCGYILVARTFLGIEDAFGPVGSLVQMPFNGHSGGYLDCESRPPDINRFEFDLTWDETVAELESVTMPEQPQGWTSTITPTSGGAHVRLDRNTAAAVVLEGYGVPENIALLGFRMLLDEAATEVTISNVGIWGPALGSPSTPNLGGNAGKITADLATDPSVGVENTSFGALKATFGQER